MTGWIKAKLHLMDIVLVELNLSELPNSTQIV